MIIQDIENGKVVPKATDRKSDAQKNKTYDKELFLQLLVAEMQYQDPLEPTSNTEYVSELASFSQIEAVQAVQDQMSTIQANSLVGKYVILNTTDSSGNQQYVSGKVDYVMKDEEGNMFLSVNDQLYSIDDLDSVADEEYYIGITKSQSFHDMIASLPSEIGLTTGDADKLKAARDLFDSMTDYQKQFVSQEAYEKLEKLEARMKTLQDAAQSKPQDTPTEDPAEDEGAEDVTPSEGE